MPANTLQIKYICIRISNNEEEKHGWPERFQQDWRQETVSLSPA